MKLAELLALLAMGGVGYLVVKGRAGGTPDPTPDPDPDPTPDPDPDPTPDPTPDPDPTPTGEKDPFGIPKLYADTLHTSFSPAPWYMGVGAYTSRIEQWNAGSGLGFTSIGSTTIFDSDQGTGNVRLNVYAPSTQSFNISESNRSALIKRNDPDGVNRGGYMADGGPALNWRDTEITMALYLYNTGGTDTCGWYARGGNHTSADPCQGFKYEPNIFYNGSLAVNCNKETAHGGGGVNAKKGASSGVGNVGNVVGQWIFWKTIFRNVPTSRKYPDDATVPLFVVNMQLWIKKTGITDPSIIPSVASAAQTGWQLAGAWNDPYPSGAEVPNWGNNPCGGVAFAVGSWGGPLVTFRADKDAANAGYGHIRIAYCSVREIDPTRQINDLVSGSPSPTGSTLSLRAYDESTIGTTNVVLPGMTFTITGGTEGTRLATYDGVTPVEFTMTSGQTYTVTAGNLSGWQFKQWSNGLNTAARSFVAGTGALSFNAYYAQIVEPTGPAINIEAANSFKGYLQLSSLSWQIRFDATYTSSPEIAGSPVAPTIELWTPDGVTKLKGPSSGLDITALATGGILSIKTTAAPPELPAYLVKCYLRNSARTAIVSNVVEFIINQGEQTGVPLV